MLYRLINDHNNNYKAYACVLITFTIMIIYNTMNTILNLLLHW